MSRITWDRCVVHGLSMPPGTSDCGGGEQGSCDQMIAGNSCAHSKSNRSLFDGYDVVCEDCGESIGRVALFASDAVLSRKEATELLHMLGDSGEGSNVKAKLQGVAR